MSMITKDVQDAIQRNLPELAAKELSVFITEANLLKEQYTNLQEKYDTLCNEHAEMTQKYNGLKQRENNLNNKEKELSDIASSLDQRERALIKKEVVAEMTVENNKVIIDMFKTVFKNTVVREESLKNHVLNNVHNGNSSEYVHPATDTKSITKE